MTGLSLGSQPITGVFKGSQPATAVYLGSQRLWPAVAAGGFAIGRGTFQFQPRGLLAETAQSEEELRTAVARPGCPW